VTNKQHKMRVALQVRIEPGKYKIGPQTIGAIYEIDPLFKNEELEWSTKRRGVAMLVGLLVKVEDVIGDLVARKFHDFSSTKAAVQLKGKSCTLVLTRNCSVDLLIVTLTT